MEFLAGFLSNSPLVVSILTLITLGEGWIIWKLWERNNGLQDDLVLKMEKYNDKFQRALDENNKTLDVLIKLLGGRKNGTQ